MTRATLPPAAAEQHIAVLGKNGSGKTFAVKAVHVEPMLEAGKLVAIVDPTSAWWGLRSSADGKSAGFKVLVLGGDHGDLPLPTNGGEAVARLIVEQRVSVVCDTGNLTVGERTRWMIDFAGTLYRLSRTPLYLVIDEAHVFAPQGKVPDPDTGKMLHAVNQLASGGRSRGIRLTMITQRPQKLHKDALTTADTLIAMRVLAPHDREAVKAWIDGQGDPVKGREVLDSLARLQKGEGWVWYPEGDHLRRGQFPKIRTFDSSATPTDGHATPAPKGAAEIDLSEIKGRLAEAVRDAEQNDPKRLRAEISRLNLQVKRLNDEGGKSQVDPAKLMEALDKGYANGQEDGYARGLDAVWGLANALHDALYHQQGALDQFMGGLRKISPEPGPKPSKPIRSTVHDAQRAIRAAAVAGAPLVTEHKLRANPNACDVCGGSDGYHGINCYLGKPKAAVGAGEPMKDMPRKILTALAQHPAGLSKGQILVHTGYRSSGPVSACFAELARNGWIDASGLVTITRAGLAALGTYEPLPVGDELRESLLNGNSRLKPMEKKLLRVVCEAYPDSIGKGRVLEQTTYASSGPVSAAFAHLVALGYCQKDGRGALKAARELFS